MTTPGPFELSQGISKTISGARTRRADLDLIDQILEKASDSGTVDDTMLKIMARVSPERQPVIQQVLKQKLARLEGERTEKANTALGLNLPKDFSKASPIAQKAFVESQKAPTPALKLNEELTQQRARTKARVEDIIRPWGIMDPFTRAITWNKNASQKERDRIQADIDKERKKSFSTQRKLFERFGQPVPDDLLESVDQVQETVNQQKIEEAYRLLTQLNTGK